ncbi:hypothetical protein LZ32DRAFT_265940 [Colletotrichum eremochloae]|nr:hypothetical protein LZ32DRAFT_265940 [Colletotrichum eremochloae]
MRVKIKGPFTILSSKNCGRTRGSLPARQTTGSTVVVTRQNGASPAKSGKDLHISKAQSSSMARHASTSIETYPRQQDPATHTDAKRTRACPRSSPWALSTPSAESLTASSIPHSHRGPIEPTDLPFERYSPENSPRPRPLFLRACARGFVSRFQCRRSGERNYDRSELNSLSQRGVCVPQPASPPGRPCIMESFSSDDLVSLPHPGRSGIDASTAATGAAPRDSETLD